MTREAKPGELREIKVLETLEKMSRRTDLRLDVQKILDRLSPTGQIYVKHLVMSGPSSLKAAAKACELKVEEVEAALTELEQSIAALRSGIKS
jgi:hypothetical protein